MSAIVHYVRSLYYKQQRDFAEFYKSSLLYLAFISMDSLPEEQKLVRYHAARMRSFLHTHGLPSYNEHLFSCVAPLIRHCLRLALLDLQPD